MAAAFQDSSPEMGAATLPIMALAAKDAVATVALRNNCGANE
jgi:hypothetical protein